MNEITTIGLDTAKGVVTLSEIGTIWTIPPINWSNHKRRITRRGVPLLTEGSME